MNEFSLLVSGGKITVRNVRGAQNQRWAAQSAKNMTSRNLGLYATAVLIEYSSLVITVGGSRFSHGPIVLFGFTGMANGIYTLFRITGRSEVFEQSAATMDGAPFHESLSPT